MADTIRMPEVLAGAVEAAIQTWLVEPGANVSVGQPLAEIETDKAVVEFAAEFEGIVGRLLAAEGDSVAVGEPILVMLSPGEGDEAIDVALAAAGVSVPSPATTAPAVPVADDPSRPPQERAAEQHAVEVERRPDPGRRLFASPLVRRLAAEKEIQLSEMTGTGPNGRIVRRDLERHLEAVAEEAAAPREAPTATAAPVRDAPTAPTGDADYEDIPLDRMRRAIARRLTESKSTVPHFYLVADCRVDALLELRAQVNASAPRKISINDFVIKAVAGALTEVPEANAIWNEDSIRRFATVDIAVAVAIDGGLTTPVLRNVARMPLTVLSHTVAELAERARAGGLKQHELVGGSFSVSNLGMYGTAQFSAILNPPQAGILAVGAARKAALVDENGQVAAGTVMTVTLSADHRVLDGAVAAQWLAAFQRRIENPLTILV